jgi:2-(1,2-epoxy-1,2-dihydrophenyl)acetyl-CoA isomerase
MTEPLILRTRQDAVLTLTLNRPAALNSFTAEMHRALRAELDAAAADASVRCLVITGAGRGFCAGQDLNDSEAAIQDLATTIRDNYMPLVQRLQAMPVPVLAAVNGVAAGAGVSIALACDLVIATRSASFIQAFSKIGLIPDAGGTWLVPRAVGRAQALGMMMLGDKLGAEAAQRAGLIWQCIDDAAFADEVGKTAQRLAAMPTQALVATRHAVDASQRATLDEALENEATVQGRLGAAHDFQEGVAAFTAKRAPRFTDR